MKFVITKVVIMMPVITLQNTTETLFFIEYEGFKAILDYAKLWDVITKVRNYENL
jgi:hypothetical protein